MALRLTNGLDCRDKPVFRYGQLGFDLSEVQFRLRALSG